MLLALINNTCCIFPSLNILLNLHIKKTHATGSYYERKVREEYQGCESEKIFIIQSLEVEKHLFCKCLQYPPRNSRLQLIYIL